jgi:hypothetical protein
MVTAPTQPVLDSVERPADGAVPAGARAGEPRWLGFAAVAVALVPIAVAIGRAVAGDWYPLGDNAYFAVRARDVLTEHHPLLGTWSSSSVNVGVPVNNPGPLFFDALAIPAKLSASVGAAVGTGLLNAGAVVGIAVFAHRRGGTRLLVAATAMASLLTWTLGSVLLVDPWQPHSMLLPFLFFLVLTWSMVDGDWVALPWAVGVASLLVQTHLTYVITVGMLAIFGVAALGFRLWRERRSAAPSWPSSRQRAVRAALIAAAVAVVCWSQPIAEQFTGEGDGNLTTLAGSVGDTGDAIGFGSAWRFVASVLANSAWSARESFDAFLQPVVVQPFLAGRVRGVVSTWAASAALAGFAVLLAAAAFLASRRDRPARSALLTASVAIVAGFVAASQMPFIAAFRVVGAHQFRWLYPLAAFALFAVAIGLIGRARWASAAFGAALVVLVLLNLPAHRQPSGPARDAESAPAARRLAAQMDTLEGRGTLLFDVTGLRFNEPYSGPFMVELQRRGIPFVVSDDGMVAQLGDERRDHGDAAARVYLREGDVTRTVPPGEERAVWVRGLDRDERRELDDLAEQVRASIAQNGLELTELGEEALGYGQLPGVASSADPQVLIDTREVLFMVVHDLIDLSDDGARLFERYAKLQQRWDLMTVAVFVDPLSPDRGGQ